MGITDEHNKVAFKGFLRTYPEYAQDAHDIARSLYSEAKHHDLPLNNDTLNAIAAALSITENTVADQYAAYQEISGFTEPSGKEMTLALRKHLPVTDLPMPPVFAECVARQELEQIRKAASGLSEDAEAHLANFAALIHLEKIAEISREATLFAMLDEECVQMRDLIDELKREGLPFNLSAQDRYNTLLSTMNEELAQHVRTQAKMLIDSKAPAQERPRPPAKFTDFIKQFQPER